jgi:rod shape-determining protein MreC
MYKKHRNENIVFTFLLLTCFYFLIQGQTPLVILIRKVLYNIIYNNIYTITHYTFNKNNLANMQVIIKLRKENIRYKIQNQQLIDKLRNYNIICQEYKDLIKLLNLKKVNNNVSIFAHIYVVDCNEWYKSVIINKGSNHGLYNGLPVVIFNKQQNKLCVLGKIQITYKASSKIILITKLLHVIPVMVENKEIHCLAEGTNSDTLKITYINKDAEIKCGDKIVTSSLGTIFQQGILVGIITKILKTNPGDDFKTAIAKVCFDNHTLCKAIVFSPSKQANNEKCFV